MSALDVFTQMMLWVRDRTRRSGCRLWMVIRHVCSDVIDVFSA